MDVRTVDWGDPNFPIDSKLGSKTRAVLNTCQMGKSYRIKRSQRCSLSEAEILEQGPDLSARQIDMIREVTSEPSAYYAGRPIFRRHPPRPNLAIQLIAESHVLDVMLDISNPGWGFYCEEESYTSWHWAGSVFKELALELFPKRFEQIEESKH